MVNVFEITSFLELEQGNIIIFRKRKHICIPRAFLEETKKPEALLLLFWYGLHGHLSMFWMSHKNHRHYCLPGNNIYSQFKN